jgi:hypothetical protein
MVDQNNIAWTRNTVSVKLHASIDLTKCSFKTIQSRRIIVSTFLDRQADAQ